MALAFEIENYFDEGYWDIRYSRDGRSFDWYQQYKELAPLLKMYTKTSDEVLMVGCGSALLSVEMAKDGYQKIMNIDISDVLIRFLTVKYKNMKQLQYKTMDVRYMKEFKDESYACVLDKGMFDNLICGAAAEACVAAMVSEVYRFVISTLDKPILKSTLGRR